jgi:hypothetical protein
MNVSFYRKKPIVVQAVKTESSQLEVAAEWCGGKVQFDAVGQANGITIPTLEGDHKADIGDFIIKGVADEFYPCKPDIFWATYETVDGAPNMGAF